MALRKFRFYVGTCGPNIMYSGIYEAVDERIAAMNFLLDMGKDCSDESIDEQLKYIKEIIPQEAPDKLLDVLEQEISIGDNVMFIKNRHKIAPELLPGKVEKISPKSIQIRTEEDEIARVILTEKEAGCLSRVVVMKPRPERKGEGITDASGYLLAEGDPVLFMKRVSLSNCEGFEVGIVKKITAQTVAVNATRRTVDRVVVINWNIEKR